MYRLITKQLQWIYSTEAIATHISKLHLFPARVRETCIKFMEAHVFPFSLFTFLNIALEYWHQDPAAAMDFHTRFGKDTKSSRLRVLPSVITLIPVGIRLHLNPIGLSLFPEESEEIISYQFLFILQIETIWYLIFFFFHTSPISLCPCNKHPQFLTDGMAPTLVHSHW